MESIKQRISARKEALSLLVDPFPVISTGQNVKTRRSPVSTTHHHRAAPGVAIMACMHSTRGFPLGEHPSRGTGYDGLVYVTVQSSLAPSKIDLSACLGRVPHVYPNSMYDCPNS